MDSLELVRGIEKAVRETPQDVIKHFETATEAFLDSCKDRDVNPLVAGLALAFYMNFISDEMKSKMAGMAGVIGSGLRSGKTEEEIAADLAAIEEEE